jgi:uncharacterized membrane protein YgdD (TMEM256/DUF423 family)
MIERIWIAIAGLSGAVAVMADAAARHVLAGDAYRIGLASTGARYGLIHALALLAVVALRDWRGAWRSVAAGCFSAGLILFPGSLYLLAAGGPPEAARLVPVGGVLFIAGWAALLVAALQPRRAQ